jgi:hypothetical protein
MEERHLSTLEFGVLILTLVYAAVGGWSIYWARAEPHSWRCRGGQVLFVVNLIGVGVAGLVAASARAQGLPPLGLVAGLLIVGMMWEGPAPEVRRPAPIAQPIPPNGQAL